jgi:hypothetical protein
VRWIFRHLGTWPISVHKVPAEIYVPSTVPGIVLRRLADIKGASRCHRRDPAAMACATLDLGESAQRPAGCEGTRGE